MKIERIRIQAKRDHFVVHIQAYTKEGRLLWFSGKGKTAEEAQEAAIQAVSNA